MNNRTFTVRFGMVPIVLDRNGSRRTDKTIPIESGQQIRDAAKYILYLTTGDNHEAERWADALTEDFDFGKTIYCEGIQNWLAYKRQSIREREVVA